MSNKWIQKERLDTLKALQKAWEIQQAEYAALNEKYEPVYQALLWLRSTLPVAESTIAVVDGYSFMMVNGEWKYLEESEHAV